MSKKRILKVILEDIIEEIDRIKKFTQGIEKYDNFIENELVFYAVLKALENIGEAVKQIPDDKRKLYPIEWKKIAGLRDILIHEYFGIDAEIIWEVVKKKLPELEKAVKFLLENEN
ncbi:HepT-like ribonuclease domain-containing protein [Anaerocellum danielii]|uniref:DUF86 domain-containing protein n=1 Tax=Anaerocellum danielii TaxID=1387557 RepID=A0ABZ0U1P6_9FIRM|nr:DUF86 domain-containing protein [Caldicellulosiruptor danielii]WPX09636.1 DUF86 domain-containing protein [Caldicellulosiruptor danielii]